ncbi:hypothetical protein [Amycolatopsis palatopharyngis]|uniref:hypothetical protein n=1 Tax=Amycolatopsis palatopharyngis TaxID=187982 RepID=UPI000E267E1C|nr:hypothetical protein [Amycolatopsis palatopharyngis]
MLGRVAAFIPITIAVGAAGAGWWLLGGLLLAAALAYCVDRGGLLASSPADPQAGPQVGTALRTASSVAVVSVCAAVFGAYVVPEIGWVGPAVLVLLVTAARVAGVTIHPVLLRWGAGLLLVAALAFVALCVAVEPPSGYIPESGPGPFGVLFAAAVAFPMFAGGGGVLRSWRLWLAAGLGLAVAGAALYQLGPIRLGLSPTSLRDVLAAADAQFLQSALAVVVALATVATALGGGYSAISGGLRQRAVTVLPLGLAAVLLADLLGPAGTLVLATVLALAEVAGAVVVSRSRTPIEVVTGALVTLLLAGLSVPFLT